MFADDSEPEICSAGDQNEQEGRQLSSPTSAHGETSSNDERSNSQIEAFPDSQKLQPADVYQHDAEYGRCCLVRQESSGSVKSQEIVPYAPICLDAKIRPLHMQKILVMVSIARELIDTYLRFRQLLGNDVRSSHEEWVQLQAKNGHPLLKVAGLAFGVISTPETSTYMEQHWDQQWDQLQEHVGQNSPDAIIARGMMDYARAWAYHREDLKKAYNIVTAFYKEMEDRGSSNFFLAPCYTVTIGRWIYDANYHHLSYQAIEWVKYYAYKTLRQLRSLKDEWAIIDTFGMKLNATELLLRVKKYYTESSLSMENLEQDIEDRLGELKDSLSRPKITTYDKAGFYSVLKLNFENVNKEEFCHCAKVSAELFRENGRIRRALEEARLSGDTELVGELEKEAQNIP